MKNFGIAKLSDVVIYHPSLRPYAGGALAAMLMGQLDYWFAKYPDGYYKFTEPAIDHKHYNEGDSWVEELALTAEELRAAFEKICTRYKSKKAFDEEQKKSADTFQGKFYCCYYDRITRLTWYFRNHDVVDNVAEEISKNPPRFSGKNHRIKPLVSKKPGSLVLENQDDDRANLEEKSVDFLTSRNRNKLFVEPAIPVSTIQRSRFPDPAIPVSINKDTEITTETTQPETKQRLNPDLIVHSSLSGDRPKSGESHTIIQPNEEKTPITEPIFQSKKISQPGITQENLHPIAATPTNAKTTNPIAATQQPTIEPNPIQTHRHPRNDEQEQSNPDRVQSDLKEKTTTLEPEKATDRTPNPISTPNLVQTLTPTTNSLDIQKAILSKKNIYSGQRVQLRSGLSYRTNEHFEIPAQAKDFGIRNKYFCEYIDPVTNIKWVKEPDFMGGKIWARTVGNRPIVLPKMTRKEIDGIKVNVQMPSFSKTSNVSDRWHRDPDGTYHDNHGWVLTLDEVEAIRSRQPVLPEGMKIGEENPLADSPRAILEAKSFGRKIVYA